MSSEDEKDKEIARLRERLTLRESAWSKDWADVRAEADRLEAQADKECQSKATHVVLGAPAEEGE